MKIQALSKAHMPAMAALLGMAALLAASCASDDTAQADKKDGGETPAAATVFSGVTQPDGPGTRTSIFDHTQGGGARVNWSATDKIWVKDDGGTWRQSTAATFPTATNKSYARFALDGTYTGTTHAVLYTNTSVTGTPQVEIKSAQTQTAPNNFDHAGESGDCGIATANGSASGYKFTLDHKASYLCLIPRSSNAYVNRSKLIKIEITGEDNIAGTYNIAADGTLTLASGGSKTITLITGSGFDLDNSASAMDKNAAYVVIAPGTHKLRIRYWLRNTVDSYGALGYLEPIAGTVTKYATLTLAPGKIYDVTANLNLKDYTTPYYMWDAQQSYWFGHEWTKTPYIAGTDQPTDASTPGSAYPRSGDAGYYNADITGGGEGTHGIFNPSAAQHVPNANEMSWYVMQGDPHWDNDELWTTMGHLYKGGMWFKKKANISSFSSSVSADGSTDLRTTYKTYNNSPAQLSSSPLSASDQANYFYLPALGYYNWGALYYVGYNGGYWSSSADPYYASESYRLYFGSGSVDMRRMTRNLGMSVAAFE